MAPQDYNFNCSSKNRVIYEARVRASVPYEKIFPQLIGRNITIYYDKNYDGIEDGYVTIAVGKDLPNFDPTPITVDQLDRVNNALDDAVYRLLDYLNFVTIPSNSGPPGSNTNPIDVELSPDVSIETATLTGVPYMWGPASIGVAVWI